MCFHSLRAGPSGAHRPADTMATGALLLASDPEPLSEVLALWGVGDVANVKDTPKIPPLLQPTFHKE